MGARVRVRARFTARARVRVGTSGPRARVRRGWVGSDDDCG